MTTTTDERTLQIELSDEEAAALKEAAALAGISVDHLCRVAIRRHCRMIKSHLAEPGASW
jgi:hypothetical protein